MIIFAKYMIMSSLPLIMIDVQQMWCTWQSMALCKQTHQDPMSATPIMYINTTPSGGTHTYTGEVHNTLKMIYSH